MLIYAVLNSENNELPDNLAKFLKKDEWKEEVKNFILQCERKRWDFETLQFLIKDYIDLNQMLIK